GSLLGRRTSRCCRGEDTPGCCLTGGYRPLEAVLHGNLATAVAWALLQVAASAGRCILRRVEAPVDGACARSGPGPARGGRCGRSAQRTRPPEHSRGRGAGGASSNDALSTLTVEHSDFTGNRASAAVTPDAGRESGQGRDGNPIVSPSNAVRLRS